MSHKVQVWRLDRSGRSSPARGSRSRTVAQNYRKVGPAVRITFPPAVSQQTFGSPQDDACCSVARSLCHRGDPGTMAYSETKLCSVLFAFALARRWREVKSNALEPGWVPTKMGSGSAPDDLSKAVSPRYGWLQ
jgi:NAD(P)-dependent dehydrogenase (short-subunit alcohol dehydrogenase family)